MNIYSQKPNPRCDPSLSNHFKIFRTLRYDGFSHQDPIELGKPINKQNISTNRLNRQAASMYIGRLTADPSVDRPVDR